MKKITVHRIFNENELTHIGTGWRIVLVVREGRKYVTVLDWTTMDYDRIEKDEWNDIRMDVLQYPRSHVIAQMKACIKRFEEITRVMQDALKVVEAGK